MAKTPRSRLSRSIERSNFLYILGFICIVIIALVYIVFVQRPFQQGQTAKMIFGLNDLESLNPNLFIGVNDIESGAISAPVVTTESTSRNLQRIAATVYLKPTIHPKKIRTMNITLEHGEDQSANLGVEFVCEECLEKQPQIPIYVHSTAEKKQVTFSSEEGPVYAYANADVSAGADSIDELVQEAHKKNAATDILLSPEVRMQVDLSSFAQSVKEYEATNTTVDMDLAGEQEFYVYAGGTLDLHFLKENTNNFAGRDATTVTVAALDNTIIDQREIIGDGIQNGEGKHTVAELSLSLDLPKEQVYKVTIVPAVNEDFIIRELSVNTNKLVFNRTAIQDQGTLYTAVGTSYESTLTPLEPSSEPVRIINETTDEKEELVIEPSTISSAMPLTLATGVSRIEIPAHAAIENGFFAPTPEAYFQPLDVQLRSSAPQEHTIILTRSDSRKINNGHIVSTTYFTPEELNGMKKNAEDKTVGFSIGALPHPNQHSLFTQLQKRFYPVAQVCDEYIFSQFERLPNEQEKPYTENCDAQDSSSLAARIADRIPNNSSINIESDSVNVNDFITSTNGVGNYSNADRELTTGTIGDARFMFFAKGDTFIELNTANLNNVAGSDDAVVRVSNASGEIVADEMIADDGDNSDSGHYQTNAVTRLDMPGLEGVYFLSIQEKPNHYTERADESAEENDLVLERIKMNTNKFVLISDAQLYSPTTVFIESPYKRDIEVASLPHKFTAESEQLNVRPSGQTITFTKDNRKENQFITLDAGQSSVELASAKIEIKNTPMAFSDDGYFQFGNYTSGSEYIITDKVQPLQLPLYSFEVNYQ